MGTKNKNSNRVTGKSVTLVYNNLNKDAIDSLSTGTFFSTINLPGDTTVTEHKVLEKTSSSVTLYIRLNKKVGFNLNYFTFHLNNNEYLPLKKTSAVSPKITPTPPKKPSKYNYTRHRCIRLVLDGSPLYYPRSITSNPIKTIWKEHLISLWKDIKRSYILKASLKQVSLHIEDKNVVLALEYKESVRYTTPPTKPIYTHMGYLKVIKYDLKADPVDCVNSALFNQGITFHDS